MLRLIFGNFEGVWGRGLSHDDTCSYFERRNESPLFLRVRQQSERSRHEYLQKEKTFNSLKSSCAIVVDPCLPWEARHPSNKLALFVGSNFYSERRDTAPSLLIHRSGCQVICIRQSRRFMAQDSGHCQRRKRQEIQSPYRRTT